MTDELLMELKSAGWPDRKGLAVGYIPGTQPAPENLLYQPFLPELIEACGVPKRYVVPEQIQVRPTSEGDVATDEGAKVNTYHPNFCLKKTRDQWKASADYDEYNYGQQEDDKWYDGSTPEEAVARLWLALQKP